MDYRLCKLHDARDTAIGLEPEEAFILNAREETPDSIQVNDAAAVQLSDVKC